MTDWDVVRRMARRKLRLLVATFAAVAAVGSGVGALASYSDYAPATRGYAKDIVKERIGDALAQITSSQQGMNVKFDRLQAQFNRSNIASLRSEKSNRELLKLGARDEAARQFFQRQIDEIDDQLRDAMKERDRISSP